MKLMKHITIALVLCAIPAVAFGQTVTCEACTHVVSVYQGNGGLIAEPDGADMVTWVSTCDGVTQSGELEPDANGNVSLSFQDEGVACHDEDGGDFMLGPVMDGGWFWISGETNSAVGNLVDMGILDNAHSVDPTDAGDSITTMDGKGATLLRHTSGRMGLLPSILPVADVAPAMTNTCSYTGTGADAAAETSNCMLGDGGSAILVRGPIGTFTGMRDPLAANATVVRPATGDFTVLADLWGNGTGHFTNGTIDNTGEFPTNPANLGHPGGRRLGATMTAALAATGPGTGDPITTTEVAGMTFEADGNSLGTLTIGQDTAYCSATANHTATVTFTATLDATQKTQVTPSLATTPAAAGAAARHAIMVVCPSASANMGVELVPDNPFPTDK